MKLADNEASYALCVDIKVATWVSKVFFFSLPELGPSRLEAQRNRKVLAHDGCSEKRGEMSYECVRNRKG